MAVGYIQWNQAGVETFSTIDRAGLYRGTLTIGPGQSGSFAIPDVPPGSTPWAIAQFYGIRFGQIDSVTAGIEGNTIFYNTARLQAGQSLQIHYGWR